MILNNLFTILNLIPIITMFQKNTTENLIKVKFLLKILNRDMKGICKLKINHDSITFVFIEKQLISFDLNYCKEKIFAHNDMAEYNISNNGAFRHQQGKP